MTHCRPSVEKYVFSKLYDKLFSMYAIKNEDEFDWAVAQLDDYEGVDAEDDETPLFKRALTEVHLNNDKKLRAWVYWFNGDISGKRVITSGDTLQYYQEKNKV